MTKKKSSTIMLTIVLAISAIALSACNQVPEEYKIKTSMALMTNSQTTHF